MSSWFDLDILNPAYWPLIGTQINTTGGGGTGALVFAITTGGVITSLNIISGGSGYTTNFSPTITGAGTGASVTLTVAGGLVTGSTSLVGGTGYVGTSPAWKLNFLANVWSALIAALASWRDNVNANIKTLSNLGGLSFNSSALTFTALSLSSSWANFGGAFQVAQYWIDPFGFVNLRGVIASGTNTDGTVVATLPAGFRPLASIAFPAIFSTGGGPLFGELLVDSSGNIKCFGLTGNTSLHLSSIRFSVN